MGLHAVYILVVVNGRWWERRQLRRKQLKDIVCGENAQELPEPYGDDPSLKLLTVPASSPRVRAYSNRTTRRRVEFGCALSACWHTGRTHERVMDCSKHSAGSRLRFHSIARGTLKNIYSCDQNLQETARVGFQYLMPPVRLLQHHPIHPIHTKSL
ncbi:hypothetical protein DFH11DRAFT_738152 [Phellopilus nigrolimitatus]|nr:hypothetical protein DFH11DRAFT_738152 [Phellopilus nigrolimitatus]